MSAAEEVSRRVFQELVSMPVSPPVAREVALAMITGAAQGYRALSIDHGRSREARLHLLQALGEATLPTGH